jgi:galactokinase/mevalonate kinase-like predicted kinase
MRDDSPGPPLKPLAAIVRRNRCGLRAPPRGAPPWHYLVLTAASEAQARLYRRELADRRARGLIPRATRVLAVPDPPGPRVGSGGGLLWALRAVARDLATGESGGDPHSLRRRLLRRRILVVQSGGDGRRSPLQCGPGKLFARLPIALPDGRASTVFDELWAALQPLGRRLPAGIMAAAGDVLIAFDPETVAVPPSGVVGLACWSDPSTASKHGVYVLGSGGEVADFLQKASPARLRRAGAVDPLGRVATDSGVLAFGGDAARALLRLALDEAEPGRSVLDLIQADGAPLDLYSDFPAALLGVAAPAASSAAALVHGALRKLPFRVIAPDPSLFAHLGTTRLFRDHLTRNHALRTVYGFSQLTASSAVRARLPASAVVIESRLASARIGAGAVLTDVEATGEWSVGRGAVVDAVAAHNLTVAPDVALKCLPVRLPDGQTGFLALICGIADDPRKPTDSPSSTFLGRPLTDWLRERGIPRAALWPSSWHRRLAGERPSLWTAKLFPFAPGEDPQPALDLALWMQEARPSPGAIRAWRAAPRFALCDFAPLIRGTGGPPVHAVRTPASAITHHHTPPSGLRFALPPGRSVLAQAPVRIDLAGGWTDTPPYCLDHGGAVVNLAINLSGKSPVWVAVTPLAEPVIRLVSEDQGAVLEAGSLRPLRAYARPGDPLAIAKAAFFCSGILREGAPLREQLRDLGGGLEVRVRCAVPQGSGLGASSIVGGAILAALARVAGRDLPLDTLMAEVLVLEQMLTTGGGWQDQVGGLTPGLKLTTSAPGFPQRLCIRPLRLSPKTRARLADRMFLYYTGHTRLAKNILRAVMDRYVVGEPAVVSALSEVRDLALGTADALEAGDLDAVGRLMTAQWERNKLLDPASTSPALDALFDALSPDIAGAKLAGAGGGGFMVVMRKDTPSAPGARALASRLSKLTGGRLYRLQPSHQGLRARP